MNEAKRKECMLDPLVVRLSDSVTIIHGDCLDVLPIECDAVITDPPYMGMKGGTALTFDSGVGVRHRDSETVADPWQASLDWVLPAWEGARRAFFSFCSFHFVAELKAAVPKEPCALISWYQRNAAPSAANAPQFKTEYCWAWRKASGLDWRALSTHIDIPRLQCGCMATERLTDSNGKALHPTQKPVDVTARLLRIGPESVCDPFMGTGTTGIACIRMGIPFVGVERDPSHFDTARKRLERELSQGRLPLEFDTHNKGFMQKETSE